MNVLAECSLAVVNKLVYKWMESLTKINNRDNFKLRGPHYS